MPTSTLADEILLEGAGQVRAFMQVTAVAGKCQVYGVISAAMLLGLDMIDMKPQHR